MPIDRAVIFLDETNIYSPPPSTKNQARSHTGTVPQLQHQTPQKHGNSILLTAFDTDTIPAPLLVQLPSRSRTKFRLVLRN